MKKKTKKRIAKLEERVKSLEVAALRAPARPNEKRLMALEHALAFNFYTLVAVSRRGQPSPMDQVVAQAIATQKRLDI
ncbi:MAG: hypothetical protein O2843_12070, partial [Chloroflexi bacterium]|nr:hypothetical protein [Chloroflexota bacterium]